MKQVVLGLLLAWSAAVPAAGTEYRIRIDGLACPYCVYGIEKKLNAIEGVEAIAVNLDKGLVIVNVADGVELTGSQLTRLFTEAGFTYRSMTENVQ